MVNPHPKNCFWHSITEYVGAPDIKYCEETLCAFISEPANTWSNLPFILVGCYIAFHLKQEKIEAMKHYGVITIILGVVSFIYHLSNNFLSQILDFLGMYLYFCYLLFLNFFRLQKIRQSSVPTYTISSLIPFALFAYILRTLHIPIQLTVALIIFTLICTEIILFKRKRPSKTQLKYLSSSVGFLALAFTFQIIDINRIGCDPSNHIIQAHGLWHTFNAVAILFNYFYYSSVLKRLSPTVTDRGIR